MDWDEDDIHHCTKLPDIRCFDCTIKCDTVMALLWPRGSDVPFVLFSTFETSCLLACLLSIQEEEIGRIKPLAHVVAWRVSYEGRDRKLSLTCSLRVTSKMLTAYLVENCVYRVWHYLLLPFSQSGGGLLTGSQNTWARGKG